MKTSTGFFSVGFFDMPKISNGKQLFYTEKPTSLELLRYLRSSIFHSLKGDISLKSNLYKSRLGEKYERSNESHTCYIRAIRSAHHL